MGCLHHGEVVWVVGVREAGKIFGSKMRFLREAGHGCGIQQAHGGGRWKTYNAYYGKEIEVAVE